MLAHRLRRWPNMVKHWVDLPCLLGYQRPDLHISHVGFLKRRKLCFSMCLEDRVKGGLDELELKSVHLR